VNINLATVTGNVGVPNTGTLKESGPSVVTGDLILGSLVNHTGVVGRHGPITINDTLLSGAATDAMSASLNFAGLPSTPLVQSQFPTNGQITTRLIVYGGPGVNVVNLSNFLLDGSGTLTLSAPAGASFVINDSGNFNLHKGDIEVAGVYRTVGCRFTTSRMPMRP
jgi:hypothetical protein